MPRREVLTSIGSGVSGAIERTAMAETLAELSARVDELERVIADMAARLERLEAATAKRAHKDRREGDAYQIGALIG
jgi:prefoldin subunit 5